MDFSLKAFNNYFTLGPKVETLGHLFPWLCLMFVRLVTYDNILWCHVIIFQKSCSRFFCLFQCEVPMNIEGELQPSRREYEATSCFHQRGVVGFRRCPDRVWRVREGLIWSDLIASIDLMDWCEIINIYIVSISIPIFSQSIKQWNSHWKVRIRGWIYRQKVVKLCGKICQT